LLDDAIDADFAATQQFKNKSAACHAIYDYNIKILKTS